MTLIFDLDIVLKVNATVTLTFDLNVYGYRLV